MTGPTSEPPLLSIVTFAYNERDNLPALYDQLRAVMESGGESWEFIVVDDHSSDGSFAFLASLAASDPRVRAIRLSRRFGSHLARTCGLHHARGACAITLAADLQDPPQLIPQFLEKWREGAQIVAFSRTARPGETASTIGFSRLYRAILNRLVPTASGVPEMSGYCLLDRRVIDALLPLSETNSNTLALLRWMGFRVHSVDHVQPPRLHGASKWTFAMKLGLVLDTITGFGPLPVRLIGATGLVLLSLAIAAAAYALAASSPTHRPWAALAALILVLSGMQSLMLALLGEYLWRTLADARRRPQFLIESTAGFPGASTR
jgi:dolichol-phosphate mannosyltransferase